MGSDEVPDRAAFRVMSWNIHHGAGTDGRLDLKRIADVIREARVDLVALQEVDRGVARTEGRDLPGELAVLTGMVAVFSNNFHYQGGEYGNAILSRLPVLTWTNRHYRMLREGEQRGLLAATVEWRGHPVSFFSTHLDYRPDEAERLANTREIREVVKAVEGVPVVVAGDFNALPESRTISAMASFLSDTWVEVGTGSGATFPSSGPSRRIDYVFLLGGRGLHPRRARVLSSNGSDHLPIVVEFEADADLETE